MSCPFAASVQVEVSRTTLTAGLLTEARIQAPLRFPVQKIVHWTSRLLTRSEFQRWDDQTWLTSSLVSNPQSLTQPASKISG